MGLVTQCFANEAVLLQHAHKTAELIAAKSPLAIVGTKRVLIHSRYGLGTPTVAYCPAMNRAYKMLHVQPGSSTVVSKSLVQCKHVSFCYDLLEGSCTKRTASAGITQCLMA